MSIETLKKLEVSLSKHFNYMRFIQISKEGLLPYAASPLCGLFSFLNFVRRWHAGKYFPKFYFLQKIYYYDFPTKKS